MLFRQKWLLLQIIVFLAVTYTLIVAGCLFVVLFTVCVATLGLLYIRR